MNPEQHELFGYVWLLERLDDSRPVYFAGYIEGCAYFLGDLPFEAVRYATKKAAEEAARPDWAVKAVGHYFPAPAGKAFDAWLASGDAPYLICGPHFMLPELQGAMKEAARAAFAAARNGEPYGELEPESTSGGAQHE